MCKNIAAIFVLVCSLFFGAVPLVEAESIYTGPNLVISEFQTGGLGADFAEDGKTEFIELHNQLAVDVYITGYKLQYFSATRTDVSDALALPTRELFEFDGLIAAEGYALLSYEGYLDDADGYFGQGSTSTTGMLAKTGGHLRLISGEGEVLDVVGWGTAASPEIKALPTLQPGYSASRSSLEELPLLLIDTDNNFLDFTLSDLPTPVGGSLLDVTDTESNELAVPPCNDALITEILPNPEGIDAGNEFIELFNPTNEVVYLEDCTLQTSANSKVFKFSADDWIAPKTYKAFYGSETGLTLPNAAGGEVLLVGTSEEFVVQYPANVAAGHTWSLVEGAWVDTPLATPHAANELPVLSDEEEHGDEEVLAPCPAGKYRHPDTNRCRNTQPAAAVLSPCAVGQIRNPETNRCRNVASLVTSLVPCKAGQERNPETNRCRSVQGASTQLKPCEEGYERNPETNRCRKIPVQLAAAEQVADSQQDKPKPISGLFLAVGTASVLGYGVYEYRRDALNALLRIKAKFPSKPSA